MNSDAVLQWIGNCKNILKLSYGACLLSRKAAIEIVSNVSDFASGDIVTQSYVSSNAQIFNKPVAGMLLVV